MTNAEFEYDVALSFAGEDRAIVHKLGGLLKSAGMKVFYDEYEAAGMWGKDLIDHLVNIYSRKARYCILCISHAYPLKKWTKAERTAAQERAFRDANEYILPLLLDDTQVPGMTETSGYRDLRQHRMEEIVDWIAQKLRKAKEQSSSLPQSHDLRSGSVSSANTHFDSLPLPPKKKAFTQYEQDRFAEDAFHTIQQYFEAALRELASQDPDIQSVFTPVTRLAFTGKVYLQGEAKAECRIWLQDSNTIRGAFGPGNGYQDTLTVEASEEELLLRIGGLDMSVPVNEHLVTQEKAAEHLWKRFTAALSK